MTQFYVAYRCTEMSKPIMNDKMGGSKYRNDWKRGERCFYCKHEIWTQPTNCEGLTLVCWNCYKNAKLAWAQT